MPAKPLSLEAFAELNPVRQGGSQCWACGIDQRDEINTARRKGTGITVIRRWLIEQCGHSEASVSIRKLQYHFTEGRHHLRTKSEG